MAGFFGYEKQHFEVSKQMAELALLPRLRQLAPDTVICATGFSCRCQIADLLQQQSYHPAQILRQRLQIQP